MSGTDSHFRDGTPERQENARAICRRGRRPARQPLIEARFEAPRGPTAVSDRLTLAEPRAFAAASADGVPGLNRLSPIVAAPGVTVVRTDRLGSERQPRSGPGEIRMDERAPPGTIRGDGPRVPGAAVPIGRAEGRGGPRHPAVMGARQRRPREGQPGNARSAVTAGQKQGTPKGA